MSGRQAGYKFHLCPSSGVAGERACGIAPLFHRGQPRRKRKISLPASYILQSAVSKILFLRLPETCEDLLAWPGHNARRTDHIALHPPQCVLAAKPVHRSPIFANHLAIDGVELADEDVDLGLFSLPHTASWRNARERVG